MKRLLSIPWSRGVNRALFRDTRVLSISESLLPSTYRRSLQQSSPVSLTHPVHRVRHASPLTIPTQDIDPFDR